jgi:5'-3' exoribonuclease 1
MVNTFPAHDRKFITTLTEDLRLSVFWDEYDDEDRNLVIWRFPGVLEGAKERAQGEGGTEDDGGEGQWEDVVEEENAAVDLVLKKYEKAPVVGDDDGELEARDTQKTKEKMDMWK